MGRGRLNDKVQEIAENFLGRGINQTELRLIPYIQYVMTNNQKLDPNKINKTERSIFQQWKKDGHVAGDMTGLSITKEFWDFMCEILFYSYVAYREEDQ